jgi:hypothetical protein
MSDLSEFVAARLDEDERAANGVLFACRDSRQPWPPEQAPGRGGPALTAYLEHFGEDRAIRDVAVKRAILDEHSPTDWTVYGKHACSRCRLSDDEAIPDGHHWMLWPCPTACAVASTWSDHPDYQPEWKL